MLVGTLCGPDYTGRGTGRIESSMGTMSLVGVAELTVDPRAQFWLRISIIARFITVTRFVISIAKKDCYIPLSVGSLLEEKRLSLCFGALVAR